MSQLRDLSDGLSTRPAADDGGSDGPEVLELGSGAHWWTATRRHRLGLVMIALAVLLAVGGVSRWWWRASDPSLTQAGVESVYRSPSSSNEPVGWDRASTFSQPGENDYTLPLTEPVECVDLLVPNLPPVSLDRVGAVLNPGLGTGVWAGSATTYRYASPAEARRKFAQLQDAARRCSTFSYINTRFEVSAVATEQSGRARADLTFTMLDSDPDVPGPTRSVLVRYGNTISWVSTSQRTRDPGTVADQLVGAFGGPR